jgi:hypothetical protein
MIALSNSYKENIMYLDLNAFEIPTKTITLLLYLKFESTYIPSVQCNSNALRCVLYCTMKFEIPTWIQGTWALVKPGRETGVATPSPLANVGGGRAGLTSQRATLATRESLGTSSSRTTAADGGSSGTTLTCEATDTAREDASSGNAEPPPPLTG